MTTGGQWPRHIGESYDLLKICNLNLGDAMMNDPTRQILLTLCAMIAIAVFVLFVLPPAVNDSEKAFRLIVAVAAILAAVLKWRRVRRGDDRP